MRDVRHRLRGQRERGGGDGEQHAYRHQQASHQEGQGIYPGVKQKKAGLRRDAGADGEFVENDGHQNQVPPLSLSTLLSLPPSLSFALSLPPPLSVCLDQGIVGYTQG